VKVEYTVSLEKGKNELLGQTEAHPKKVPTNYHASGEQKTYPVKSFVRYVPRASSHPSGPWFVVPLMLMKIIGEGCG
jgi:hypothetical protein